MIKKSVHSDKALEFLQSFVGENRMFDSLVTTTQAIDLIEGGVKSNALPELAWALVNHRISVLRYYPYPQSTSLTDRRSVTFFIVLSAKFKLMTLFS